MKRGKTVHVPDLIYKKGCVHNVQEGMEVLIAFISSKVMRWSGKPC